MIKAEEITAYKISSSLSDQVWHTVTAWSVLAQKTIGEQLIRSTDSIAANIIEAEGRYFKKDKIKFYYQARGSVYEAAHWIEKAKQRNLITEKRYNELMTEFRKLPREINYLISNIAKNLKR
ncbi:MAG: four helix bundle protein [Candidatus Woesebacteria bacterium]|nr:four helix bundle protein [Candidatus Woesebacteria bacterium]